MVCKGLGDKVKIWISAFLFAAFGLAWSANAATLLSLEDSSTQTVSSVQITEGEALAVSFELLHDIDNFSATANVVCLNCTANVWLYGGELNGPDTSGDLLGNNVLDGTSLIGDATIFDASNFEAGATTTLLAGTYHLVFHVIDNPDVTAPILLDWNASIAPTVTTDYALDGADWETDAADPVAPFTDDFDIRIENRLLFSLFGDPVTDTGGGGGSGGGDDMSGGGGTGGGGTGGGDGSDVSVVPLPASGVLLAGALAGLMAARRRKKAA